MRTLNCLFMENLLENSLQRLLMGNEAMGLGIVEAGCTLAASYPGTRLVGYPFPPFSKGGTKGGLFRRAALQ